MNCTIIFALILASLCLCQSAPFDGNNAYQAIESPTDLTGQSVRQKRQSDYFICYPSSVVYGYYYSPNALSTRRRSSFLNSYDSFDNRADLTDRAREAYINNNF
ncbi:GH21947 [Drosophila grimshawi]|uniref:GH21947 n=1 Tax=Drosophila grimshawi TaxID=7222 RepID=B4J8R3_DROGR|nr:GH21947 [Drosophila grimshawi]